MNVAKALGLLIYSRRTSLGISTKEFARQIGKSIKYVQLTERGKEKMTFATFKKVVRALRMPPKEFIDLLNEIALTKPKKKGAK